MTSPVAVGKSDAAWEPCAEPGCGGAQAAGRSCAAHLDDQTLDHVLARLGRDQGLDVRGVSIDSALLGRIVDAGSKEGDEGRRIGRVRLEGARIASGVDFGGLSFTHPVSFDGAVFDGDARFEGTTFVSHARFARVRVAGDTSFTGATFGGHAWFGGASFTGPASFERACFADLAWFGHAMFAKDVRFNDATFSGQVSLAHATFGGKAQLTRTSFAHEPDLPETTTGRRMSVAGEPGVKLSSWWRRVAAVLIDSAVQFLIVASVVGIGWVLETKLQYAGARRVSSIAGPGAGALFGLWNLGRQGRTGQTTGKHLMNIAVVRVRDGRPIGAARSFLRQIAHSLDTMALLLGWLWPLWDKKRQTFADKCCRTQVVRRGRVRGGAFVGALSLISLAATGTGAALVVRDLHRYPDEWDPRAVDLVAFVERERGLTFKHPVEIDFLDDAAFRKEVTSTEAPDEQDQEESKSTQAMLRALGLLSEEIDLQAVGNELAGDGILGLYSPKDKRVLIRGDKFDDRVRLTLVHELTHVLQDQRFDIGGYKPENSGEDAAYTAVVEADAEEVENAWRETLPAAAREKLDAAEEDSLRDADFNGVPEVFIELMGFPYAFGPDFLRAVIDKEGVAGRNRLFTTPPTTEEHIILAETYLDGQKAERVKVPALTNDEHLVKGSEGDAGMLSLLVMLTERIDFGTAWPSVQGWAGDSFVVFERTGVTCARVDVVFDEAAQAERFAGVFAKWSEGRSATHTRTDRSVLFESCDPGAKEAGGRGEGHVSAIEGLALRRNFITEFKALVPAEAAACTADAFLERLSADRAMEIDGILVKDPQNRVRREVERVVAQVMPGCIEASRRPGG